ncbi:MAG: ABC transporter permease [Spirochaetota bacterium]
MFKYIKIAFRNVIANKRRSLFISTAIAIGTLIMILTMSLSIGIRENMIKNSLALFTGHVNIYGTEYINNEKIYRIKDIRKIEEVINENLPNAKVLYRTANGGSLYNPNRNDITFQRSILLGLNIEKEFLLKESVTVIEGDIMSIKKDNYCAIDLDTANEFEVNVGDTLSYEGKIEHPEYGIVNNTIDFTVGAIIQGLSLGPFGSIVRVNIDTEREFSMRSENEISRVAIFLDDIKKSTEAAELLEEKIKEANYTVDEKDRSDTETSTSATMTVDTDKEKPKGLHIKVRTWQEEISFLEEMIDTVDMISAILLLILAAIILMGISNTLVMTIRERTGEIGTLRAMGMQRPSVLIMFLIEGIILGILGSLIGIIIGGGISLYFTFNGIYIGPSPISIFLVNNSLYFKLTAESILITVLIVVTASAVASLYPSYKATKLRPITAIQKEE